MSQTKSRSVSARQPIAMGTIPRRRRGESRHEHEPAQHLNGQVVAQHRALAAPTPSARRTADKSPSMAPRHGAQWRSISRWTSTLTGPTGAETRIPTTTADGNDEKVNRKCIHVPLSAMPRREGMRGAGVALLKSSATMPIEDAVVKLATELADAASRRVMLKPLIGIGTWRASHCLSQPCRRALEGRGPGAVPQEIGTPHEPPKAPKTMPRRRRSRSPERWWWRCGPSLPLSRTHPRGATRAARLGTR